MTAYLFAGQGSQYVGMGKDLYEAFPEAKDIFDRADKVLGFSISKLCFEGPQEELTRTRNCQPAILAMSIAVLEAYRKVIKANSPLPQPVSYMAGLSLGEYAALVAAGAIGFEDAVYLVRQRGQFMEDAAGKTPGKMLSLIGLDLNTVKKICVETNTEIANINCPGQTVISGGIKEIEKAEKLSKEGGAKMAVMLEVSGAFHSSAMRDASLNLAKELNKIKISLPKIPVIANVTAKPYNSCEEIKNNLILQVSSCVLWEDSMKFILSQGVKDFIEFGPGKVLRGLMRRIEVNARVANIERKEDVLNLRLSEVK